MNYSDSVKFHGHECPGLAMGYRMARAAMEALNTLRSADEEIVAIVENDACGVDALQHITGCTFGKGNLIFHDYGKKVYTLYSRSTKKGVRVVFHGKGVPAELRDDRAERIRFILKAPRDDLLSITQVIIDEPEPARIRNSVPCAVCGEDVMADHLREVDGKSVCVPCAKSIST